MGDNSGASIGGNVSTGGGSFAGRDQMIQNIIVVGQFLDFAGVQGLLPQQPGDWQDVNSVVEAFQKTFDPRAKADFAQAVAAVGSILSPLLKTWQPERPYGVVRWRDFIPALARAIGHEYYMLGYWELFSEAYMTGTGSTQPVIWLPSTSDLWKKRIDSTSTYQFGLVSRSEGVRDFAYLDAPANMLRSLTTNAWPPEKGRVFFTGVVLDMIRLASQVHHDRALWDSLTDLFTPKS